MDQLTHRQPFRISPAHAAEQLRGLHKRGPMTIVLPTGVDRLRDTNNGCDLRLSQTGALAELEEERAKHVGTHSAGEHSHGERKRATLPRSDRAHGVHMTNLHEQLRAARIRSGLTAGEVGRLIGRTQSVVSRWELGTASMPGFDVVVRWAAAVGLQLRLDERREDDPFEALRAVMTEEEARRLVTALSIVKKAS
jgi:transcriptional regulator with XRE-family HTH domain